ncbi:hypothetical protein HBI81_057000 [Parastagonospora nodorum]|nr:hypothetical protein HBH49_005600 [Parastagonospora nodorum]KAH4273476.1 hypothetical protein HBI03_011180 [Parastagonospora nodorum]KAH4336084.1 hypothetical protein HBI00_027440 [Parastagonospora nodorum]KAH4384542.1 hypothetical protein HBH94_054340 [Parastagonospora nodorum]KAH4594950.1 hypothetical protein HBH83_036860 [Parastagonospora nodorum]
MMATVHQSGEDGLIKSRNQRLHVVVKLTRSDLPRYGLGIGTHIFTSIKHRRSCVHNVQVFIHVCLSTAYSKPRKYVPGYISTTHSLHLYKIVSECRLVASKRHETSSYLIEIGDRSEPIRQAHVACRIGVGICHLHIHAVLCHHVVPYLPVYVSVFHRRSV